MENEIIIHDSEKLKDKIYTIRGLQVMLDEDLAQIYGYATKDFNRQVKNNIERFDEDFRFQLTDEEFDTVLRCKFSTSKTETRGGRQYNPYAFTEQGIFFQGQIFDYRQYGFVSYWSISKRLGQEMFCL